MAVSDPDSSDSDVGSELEPDREQSASRKRSLVDLSEFEELKHLLDNDGVDSIKAARLLRTVRLEPGIGTEDEQLGHAVGQWVLAVRCDCGRRWFELQATLKATCPRCGSIVCVEIESSDDLI